MAHFAEIDKNSTVVRVLVVSDEHQNRGQDYLAIDLGLGGTWIQTSYNGKIRGQFAGIGMTYDSALDRFIPEQNYPSWKLDENFVWQPPVAYPNDGKSYSWDEKKKKWILDETLSI